jgi:hypothetical protein
MSWHPSVILPAFSAGLVERWRFAHCGLQWPPLTPRWCSHTDQATIHPSINHLVETDKLWRHGGEKLNIGGSQAWLVGHIGQRRGGENGLGCKHIWWLHRIPLAFCAFALCRHAGQWDTDWLVHHLCLPGPVMVTNCLLFIINTYTKLNTFLVVHGFELRDWCLLGGCSTTWAVPPVLSLLVVFSDRVSHFYLGSNQTTILLP